MATDATGTPTSLGIPKYDVNVDAPSGLGFNATMDAINALLVAGAIFPGHELAYVEFNANVTVTATTAAGANTVVSAGSVVFDGTPVWVEFFAIAAQLPATAGAAMAIDLWNDSTDLGILGDITTPAAVASGPSVLLRRKVTPTAAAHTFSVRAWMAAGGAITGTVVAGGGGASVALPGFIRITKA
jgi:hypothetical protein